MLDDADRIHHRPATITRTERQLIEDHIARHGVTVCPPMTHSRPEWGEGPLSWREQKQAQWRSARARRAKVA